MLPSFEMILASFRFSAIHSFSPLCGFFSVVRVLLWALAFSVNPSGNTWKMVLFSDDCELIWNSCLHRLPSLIVGILMDWLGPKNPFFVILLILVTLVCFYVVMWATGMSLEEAQHTKWFWSHHELVYEQETTPDGSSIGLLESWTLLSKAEQIEYTQQLATSTL